VLAPAFTVCDDGEALSEKSATAVEVTVSETVVECESEPAVPLMVTVAVVLAALEDAESVSVEPPPPETELGLNEAVTPDGRPEALSEIEPGLPVTVVETATVPCEPAATVRLVGEAASEKSFVVVWPTTVSEPLTVCEVLPAVPLTVKAAFETEAALEAAVRVPRPRPSRP
jgi:hypothetical protein